MIRLTYDDMHAAAKKIAEQFIKLKGMENAESLLIVAEPLGGMPLAVRLSHLLQNAPVAVRQPGIEKVLEAAQPKTILWVDGVIDSGKTMNEARRHLETELYLLTGGAPRTGVVIATWLDKRTANTGPEESSFLCAATALSYMWIVFPWEDADKAGQDEEAYQNRRKR